LIKDPAMKEKRRQGGLMHFKKKKSERKGKGKSGTGARNCKLKCIPKRNLGQ